VFAVKQLLLCIFILYVDVDQIAASRASLSYLFQLHRQMELLGYLSCKIWPPKATHHFISPFFWQMKLFFSMMFQYYFYHVVANPPLWIWSRMVLQSFWKFTGLQPNRKSLLIQSILWRYIQYSTLGTLSSSNLPCKIQPTFHIGSLHSWAATWERRHKSLNCRKLLFWELCIMHRL